MNVTLSFDTEKIINSSHLGPIEQYLRGNIKAIDAARELGWSKETWESHLAALFSVALSGTMPHAAKIEVRERTI